MNKVVETVTVSLAPGVDEHQFLSACAATEDFLKAQPGFLWRRIVKNDDGRYMDILEWRGQTEADAAMQASMQEPCMAALMQSIDIETVVVAHHKVVAAV